MASLHNRAFATPTCDLIILSLLTEGFETAPYVRPTLRGVGC
jgi:hypothetical protein